MTRRANKNAHHIRVSPGIAIVCSLILGGVYFGTEAYKHHYSYHYINGIWQVCFTPNQHCQSLIIRQIDEAKESIRMQAYGFSDKDILAALLRAKKRQVQVEIILDYSNLTSKHSLLQDLLNNKIKVKLDKPEGIAHNKLIIVDNRIVVGGSYNFTNAAYKRNTENLLIIHEPELARKYIENWEKRWNMSTHPLKDEKYKVKMSPLPNNG